MSFLLKLLPWKPPPGILRISDRVYVFDSCFSLGALKDDDYTVYMKDIVCELCDRFPDASSCRLFNFRDEKSRSRSQIADILSVYDVTVIDYPRDYNRCPLLTMETIHHFLRSSDSWLSFSPHNLLLMHCERGGWPVLAFMLACLLIYTGKHYTGKHKILNYIKHNTGEHKILETIYKQAPPKLLQLLSTWDPLPSQLRYLLHLSDDVGSKSQSLTLDCIRFLVIPNIDRKGGCRPIFQVYGQDPFRAADPIPKFLFSTPKRSKSVRHIKQADCEVTVDIHCHIQGDVVLNCYNLDDDLERVVKIFRVMFNTAFIRSDILILNRDDIDIHWDYKDLFPKDFRAEVLFSKMDMNLLHPKPGVCVVSPPPPPPPPLPNFNHTGPSRRLLLPLPPTLKNGVGPLHASPTPFSGPVSASSLSTTLSTSPPLPGMTPISQTSKPFEFNMSELGSLYSAAVPSDHGISGDKSSCCALVETKSDEDQLIMEHSKTLEENLQDLLLELNDLKRVGDELGRKGEWQIDPWLQNVESSMRSMDEMQKEVEELKEEVDELRSLELNMKVIQTQKVVKTLKEGALQIFLHDIIGDKLKRFSHGDLDSMTSKFSKQIGSGGFGKVYFGQYPRDGFQVAIKVLMQNEGTEKIFMVEVNTMLRASHPNLIKLYGFCFDSNMKALVYEYMEKGSLDQILYKKPLGIKWEKLYDIAIEIAKALAHLHHGCEDQIIHHDLKPANVLLDSNLSAKITDFGTARIMSRDVCSFTMTKIRGTRGYTAPEMILHSSRVTCTCDVYSFGMILFEFLGMRNNSFVPGQVWENLRMGKLDEIIMESSIGHWKNGIDKARILSVVALWCVQFTPHIRPSMINVVHALEKGLPITMPPDPSYSWNMVVSMQLAPEMKCDERTQEEVLRV